MSDTLDQVTREYDVFIIFAGCDMQKAEHIYKCLTQENFRCLAEWDPDAFPPGRPVFDSIVANMGRSQNTLLILSNDSFTKSWVSLETILALEHSVQRGQLTLRLLLYGVQESEIKFLKKGILESLESIPDIYVNVNKENWQEQLADSLRSCHKLPDILPVGCLAHVQVFSHFVGYLVYLLPQLEQIIKEAKIYQQKQDCFSKKICMLLPGSCKLPDLRNIDDPESGISIKEVEVVEKEIQHAGISRKINPSVFRVSKGTEEYYFIADTPNVLKTIHRIASEGLAKVDVRFQIARFYYTMNEVLNHAENIHCANKVTLVPYNDSVEDPADVVFQAVRQDVLCQRTQEAMVSSSRTPQRILSRQHSYEADVLVVTCDDPKDCEYANKIQLYLESHNKKVVPKKASFMDLSVARWVVFIISKASLASTDGLLLKCVSVLVDSISENMLRTLPVLVDVEPKDMPQMIRWVTLVSVSESTYKERLLQTVNGETIRVQDRLPSGDVATGLTWAYVLNYLTLTLLGRSAENKLDFFGRIQKLLRDKQVQCGCIPKLFLLVPKSCLAQPDTEKELQKGCHDGVCTVKKVGRVEPIKVGERSYWFHMYKYTDCNTRKSTCFLCEYSTPIYFMHQMANTYPFAGLHKGEMYKQAESIVQLFPCIVGREAVKRNIGDISDRVQLIYFDDEKETLLNALKSQIKFEDIVPAGLVYA